MTTLERGVLPTLSKTGVISNRVFRGSNQLFANPSAMAMALRMAMDLFTVS